MAEGSKVARGVEARGQRIDSIDDPRVGAYRNLRERTLRGESLFVAEGDLVTRRLLASRYRAESVFVTEKYAEEFSRLVGDVPLYVADEPTLVEVVGFKFHRGVLGAGRRRPSLTLDALMARTDRSGRLRLVICPEITKPENVGLVFRSSAGFGVDGVILGPRCCDPLSRRSLRVSMGAVLLVPFVCSTDLEADLGRLKASWGVELAAAVLDDRAERLDEFRWPGRTGLLVGNEYDGLGPTWLPLCDRRVTIPMAPGTDSLNLGVAAGVFLYEMTRAR